MNVLGLVAAVAACVAYAGHPEPQVPGGTVAPKFTGKRADGKTFSLDDELRVKKHVFVYFISTSCPVSKEATPHYTAFAKAYAALGITVVGVVNDDKAGFDVWNRTHKVPYPVVLDKDKKIINAYKVEAAPSAVFIGTNGKVIKSWTGYSKPQLLETNQLAAKSLGKTAPKLAFDGAPASWQAG